MRRIELDEFYEFDKQISEELKNNEIMENLVNTQPTNNKIKIKGTTLNMDLKQIRLNTEIVSNLHGDFYHCYEDKENLFSYHIKPTSLKNHVRIELHTEDLIKNKIFHKKECREIKTYIDNFLLEEITQRKLN